MKLSHVEILIKCDCGESISTFTDGQHDKAKVEVVYLAPCKCGIKFFAHIQEVKPL